MRAPYTSVGKKLLQELMPHRPRLSTPYLRFNKTGIKTSCNEEIYYWQQFSVVINKLQILRRGFMQPPYHCDGAADLFSAHAHGMR